jgi:hypothetical protein
VGQNCRYTYTLSLSLSVSVCVPGIVIRYVKCQGRRVYITLSTKRETICCCCIWLWKHHYCSSKLCGRKGFWIAFNLLNAMNLSPQQPMVSYVRPFSCAPGLQNSVLKPWFRVSGFLSIRLLWLMESHWHRACLVSWCKDSGFFHWRATTVVKICN